MIGTIDVEQEGKDNKGKYRKATLYKHSTDEYYVLHFGGEEYAGLRTNENQEGHKGHTWVALTATLTDSDGEKVTTCNFRAAISKKNPAPAARGPAKLFETTTPRTSPRKLAAAKHGAREAPSSPVAPKRSRRMATGKNAAVFCVDDLVVWASETPHPARHAVSRASSTRSKGSKGKGKANPPVGKVLDVNKKTHENDADTSGLLVEWRKDDKTVMTSIDPKQNFELWATPSPQKPQRSSNR